MKHIMPLLVFFLLLSACEGQTPAVANEPPATQPPIAKIIPSATLVIPSNTPPPTSSPTLVQIFFHVFFENIADKNVDLALDAVNAVSVQKGGSATLDYYQNRSGFLFVCSENAEALDKLVLAGNLGKMSPATKIRAANWDCNPYEGNLWNLGNPDGSILVLDVGIYASPFEQFFQLFMRYNAAAPSNGQGGSGGGSGHSCPPGQTWYGPPINRCCDSVSGCDGGQ